MLESLGLGEAVSQDQADVIVFNTCTIREKPDQRLAAHLAQAKALKDRDPGRVIAVGGCYAEAQRDRIFSRYPFVDVAFGPGSIPHLADWLGAGGRGRRPAGSASGRTSPANCRPAANGRIRRGSRSRWAATPRARTASSPPCAAASSRGGPRTSSRRWPASQRTAFARSRCSARTSTPTAATCRPRSAPASPSSSARCDGVEGIERIRFTSPHPKDFRPDVIARDGRVRRRLRARPPAAPVRLDTRC